MRIATNVSAASLACVSMLCLATPSGAQQVAEIPFFLAPDNDETRTIDLIPLYLYEGRYIFARGTSGGVHIVNKDAFEINAFMRYRFQKLDPESNALEKAQFMGQAGLAIDNQSVDGTPAYNDGVTVFVVTRIALMGEFTVSGAKFTFQPIGETETADTAEAAD